MNQFIDKLYRRLLKFILNRSCSDRVPRSGEAGERINCFSVRIDDAANPYFWARSMEGAILRGKRWDGHSFATDFELNYTDIDPATIQILHYYGLSEVRYRGMHDVARTWFFPVLYLKIHLQRLLSRIQQYVFNMRSLERVERLRILKLLRDRHVDNGHPLSVIDVMTELNSLMWVLHPNRDTEQRKVELHLESLCESGELGKQNHRYVVTGRTISTIEKFEEDERRHRENTRIQWAMVGLTLMIALLTLVQAGLVKLPMFIDLSK